MLSPSADAVGSGSFPSRGVFCQPNQGRNETLMSELCRADAAAEKAAMSKVEKGLTVAAARRNEEEKADGLRTANRGTSLSEKITSHIDQRSAVLPLNLTHDPGGSLPTNCSGPAGEGSKPRPLPYQPTAKESEARPWEVWRAAKGDCEPRSLLGAKQVGYKEATIIAAMPPELISRAYGEAEAAEEKNVCYNLSDETCAFETHAQVVVLSPSANAVGSKGFPSRGASYKRNKKGNETLPPELCGAEAAVGEAAAAEKTESPHAKVAMLSPSADAVGSKGFPSRGALSPQSKKRNETFRSELCRTDDARKRPPQKQQQPKIRTGRDTGWVTPR